MTTSHQSPGYYDYTCTDQDCWYCEMMRPKIDIPIGPDYEMQFMRDNWQRLSMRDIGYHLRISVSCVAYRAYKYKLGKKKHIVPMIRAI